MRTEEKQQARSANTTQRTEALAPLKRAPRISLPEACGSTAAYYWYPNPRLNSQEHS